MRQQQAAIHLYGTFVTLCLTALMRYTDTMVYACVCVCASIERTSSNELNEQREIDAEV
jgi:hypothetical protein